MTVRLVVSEEGEKREFVFDRDEISIGCEAFNDIVLGCGDGARVHGALSVDGEQMQFASRVSEVPTSILREDTCILTVGGDERAELSVQVGDTIRLGSETPAEVEIVDRSEEASSARLEAHQLSDAETVQPGAETSHLLWQVTDAISREPGVEELLRGLASVLTSVVEERPAVLTLSFLENEGEVEDHIYRLEVADDGGSYEEVLLPGVYTRERAPLVGLGIDRQKIVEAIEGGDQFVAIDGGREETSIFLPLGNSDFRAMVDVRFDELDESTELERIGLAGALVQPMGRVVLKGVAKELESLELAEENRYFRQRERRHYLFKDLICESEEMREVYQTLNDWVDLESPVLIEGEAGSGKSLMARALHHLGPRTDGMLISLDCRALSEEVLESELFGCVESELVGAVAPRKGVFELTSEGTVFLEEIDHLSSTLQGKLLRVVKEGEVRRIGDAVGREVQARLIASTHRDLAGLVERGQFRRDLYMLLQEHVLEVPPLRDRDEDILPLARVYLRKFADRYERNCDEFSDAVTGILQAHNWLGNARELKAVVESAVLKAEESSTITPEHLSL
jgi:transcriptional regulator with GAF, ATPase, and Fis domain